MTSLFPLSFPKYTYNPNPASTAFCEPHTETMFQPSQRSNQTSQPQKQDSSPAAPILVHNQQRILNLFSDSFQAVLSSDSFTQTLQEIKQALFNRDFDLAFGKEEYLEAYAARWSPSRALCYANVFLTLKQQLAEVTSTFGKIRMISIGGCAAEHVGFASYLSQTHTKGTLTLVDSAPWANVAATLQSSLTTPPPLSKYASESAKASNAAFLPQSQLTINAIQQDALAMDKSQWAELLGTKPIVLTIMFTLNELYTNGGIKKTTELLKTLAEVLPHNSLLLVVDSPGSYSETAIGKEKKRYPMQWLLNHTLEAMESETQSWHFVDGKDSIWFRLPEHLSYPIQLENMRYLLQVYQWKKS